MNRNLRKFDPTFTDYVPSNCEEAVALFYKKKALGHIKWDDLDITLRHLARGLDQEQFNKFVGFICNPFCVQPGDQDDCFPASGIIPSGKPSSPNNSDQNRKDSCPN